MAQYSDKQREEFLASYASTENVAKSCRLLGIGYGAGLNWSKGIGLPADGSVVRTARERREQMAAFLDDLAEEVYASIDEDTIKEAPLRDRVAAGDKLITTGDRLRGVASPDAVAMGPDNAVRASAMAKLAALNIPIEGLTHEASESTTPG